MAVYTLINAATVQGTAPSPTNPPQQAQQGAPGTINQVDGPSNPNSPSQTQWFQLTGSATSGNITVIATIYTSNDGKNWTAYATTMAPAAAASVNAGLQTALPAKYFAASFLTLTGTGATATLTMSA